MPNKWPKSKKDLEAWGTKIYCILTPTNHFVPKSERLTTSPGHRYGSSTEHNWNIEVFKTVEEWKEEIARLTNIKANFVPVIMDRPDVRYRRTITI